MIDGDTLLEIGGGIGDLQVELLKTGMDCAISVELSPSYEAEAAKLLRASGLESRVTRLVGDFVALFDHLEPADLVVMHSVISCYPDVDRLVGRAAEMTRRYLVVSYPLDIQWTRLLARVQNVWYEKLRRTSYRFFINSPTQIHASAIAQGLELIHEERRFVDHLDVLERRSTRGA